MTVLDKDEHSQKDLPLTDEGRALVEEWIKEETPAYAKDEFLAKSMLFRRSIKQQLLDCYSLENNS